MTTSRRDTFWPIVCLMVAGASLGYSVWLHRQLRSLGKGTQPATSPTLVGHWSLVHGGRPGWRQRWHFASDGDLIVDVVSQSRTDFELRTWTRAGDTITITRKGTPQEYEIEALGRSYLILTTTDADPFLGTPNRRSLRFRRHLEREEGTLGLVDQRSPPTQ